MTDWNGKDQVLKAVSEDGAGGAIGTNRQPVPYLCHTAACSEFYRDSIRHQGNCSNHINSLSNKL